MVSAPDYAELHALSNFSFLRGASHAEELVAQARALGYRALAITDECSVAGVVRAWEAAREHKLKLIVGSEIVLDDGLKLVLLARSRRGYGQLSWLITQGRRAAEKGGYHLTRDNLAGGLDECFALWVPGDEIDPEQAHWLREQFGAAARIAVELHRRAHDRERLDYLQALSDVLAMPCVAAGDVHMHSAARQPLQDTLTAIRLGKPVAACGYDLFPNAERHLRSRADLARLYPSQLLAESIAIAEACDFSLGELRYEYPGETVPAGYTPSAYLHELTHDGLARRYPKGVPEKIAAQAERELALVAEMRYEAFFLTVYDIVEFARSQNILCQGRGSAANSVICYALGITEVNPHLIPLVFERFISRERDEPPDIDVDFEHQRREEVIQYIYQKYGRQRAALAATVISYRARSAVRDVGKALGLDASQIDSLAGNLQWWDQPEVLAERVREAGLNPDSRVIRQLLALVNQLRGFPRHLSQHVGGFVISAGPLAELVPVENAAMPERTVIQWDKDDLEALGLLKVDVLGLGMLTVIRRAFDLINRRQGSDLSLANLPREDQKVYAMICAADTVGVFQIESRAQMAMLPRLRPREYYDLVIQVAIVRPGPIQGDMVHPYLARRSGEQNVEYPDRRVKAVLERTLGVPIFQEQAMQLAVVAAGFTPGEADQLRRAMAAWKRKGGIEPFRDRLLTGMRERGYSDDFAQRLYQQMLGFGEYGFPESHAASFALLAYASAWLKYHYPAAFTAALLNSQPMGFYAPAQLLADARRHGVEVAPVDVQASDWDCQLEGPRYRPPVLRLGLRMVGGLREEAGEAVVAARHDERFTSARDLAARAGLDSRALDALADANALRGFSRHRYRAAWDVAGVEKPLPLLGRPEFDEAAPLLARPGEGREIVADYRRLGFTLGRHPLALLRERLAELRLGTAQDFRHAQDEDRLAVAGIVINRQRPGSAKGVMFMTLEDETGYVNVVVWPKFLERKRRVLLGSQLLEISGRVQRQGEVIHLVAQGARDHSRLLGQLETRSRDFQ